MECICILIILIVKIASSYCYNLLFNEENISNEHVDSILNNDNNNLRGVKIYDFGTPSNLQELFDIQNNRLPLAKIKYLKYKTKQDFSIKKGKALKSIKPFNFNIKSSKDCPEMKIFEKALKRAEDEISNALEIKNTINVDVYIEDFCETLQSVTCASLVGKTYSPIYVALKEGPNEREYAYPQALAKQLSLDKEIEFSDHDLIIYLNTNMANENYSELITTHEILHGLGFMGNGVVIGKSIGMKDITEELFSPYIYYDIKNVGQNFNYQLLGFLPFTVYEKHIVAVDEPNTYLYRNGFDEFYNKSVNITSYILNTLSSSSDQFSVLSGIYKDIYSKSKNLSIYRKIAQLYITQNAVGFKSSDGEIIKLQTFNNKYLSASTICHIAVPFKCETLNTCSSIDVNDYDNDYLMYFSLPLKLNVNELLKKFNNRHDFIGPKIMKILTTIGWAEKGNEYDNKTYYVVDDQFPDIYDNLFEINSNNKMINNKESAISKSNNLNSHFISIIILLLLLFFIIYY